MSLGQRLRDARVKAGYTQKSLALELGAKHNSVSNWENGKNSPDPQTLERLCRLLGVTPNHLLLGEPAGQQEKMASLTAEEWGLVRRYRSLAAEARGAVAALLDYYAPAGKRKAAVHAALPYPAEPAVEVITGYLSSQTAAAGGGTYLDPDAFDTLRLLKNEHTARASFFVPVAGDSMEPRFYDGDILMVEDAAVECGEIGVFTLGGCGYVKMRGNGELLSLNPRYQPIAMEDGVRCNGRVIGVLDPAWIVE